MSLSPPVFVVFFRKRWNNGSARKYVSNGGGFTENWRNALRFTDRGLAEVYRKRLRAHEAEVVEETRELPAPDGGLFRGRSL